MFLVGKTKKSMINIKKISHQNRNSVFNLYQKIYPSKGNSITFLKIMNRSCHLGFCGYMNNKLICFVSTNYVLNEIDIIELGVAYEMRRRGIGYELITCLQFFCVQHNIRKIFLEVAKNNIAAIGLYEKAGFNKIRTRKNYYMLNCFSMDGYEYCWNMNI